MTCVTCWCQKISIAVYVVGEDGGKYYSSGNGYGFFSPGTNAQEKQIVESSIVSELLYGGAFKIADRSETISSAISQEYAKQSSGDVDYKQIAKLGQQIGAKYILVVQLSGTKAYTSGTLTSLVKLINVEENSVLVATDFVSNKIYDTDGFRNIGKRIAEDVKLNLRRIVYRKNPQFAIKLVGPLTFQQACDYEIPTGFTSLEASGMPIYEAVEKLYIAGVDLSDENWKDIVLSKKIKEYKKNNLEEILYFFSCRIHSLKNRHSNIINSNLLVLSYSLDKNNWRYKKSNGVKLDKREEPFERNFYYILISNK